MTQPQLVVPRAVVDALVDDFIASPKRRERGVCSTFDPEGIRAALRDLPSLGGVDMEVVDFHGASRVIGRFECYKCTGFCNTWTPWMRHRLNGAKFAAPSPLARS